MASRVGKYLLFETLGEGAFGKVKLGVHEESGEQVAVKIMDKSDIKAQEMTMNVRREIAIMKALKHRNIVNLRQVLTSQSKLYIVMDLVTGGELFTKILTEGKLEEPIARRYFQQLVDGIEYCHRRGVCHRDLKPENLLIDETTGELKITDFGLSAMKGASTTEELLHTQCGSPNYCAPEIIARHKQGYNGAKVDAWSCGIILFALLAGFLPFYDENTKVLYRMIQRDEVKFPRRFPPEAKDLVLRLLHKEPEKRYTLVEVKKHPWFVIDYEGDDSMPKHDKDSAASPPVTRRKKRGHGRKASMDQAPRSSREGVSRKRSGKSDRSDRSDRSDSNEQIANAGVEADAGSKSSTVPVGQPMPPPIAVDLGPRAIPMAHRPPISPQPTQAPQPPLVTPSPRGVPPYPGSGSSDHVRRKSRESRESLLADGPPGGSMDSGRMTNISDRVPSYASLSEGASSGHFPPPPSFPAPDPSSSLSSVQTAMSGNAPVPAQRPYEPSAISFGNTQVIPPPPVPQPQQVPLPPPPPPPPPAYTPPVRGTDAAVQATIPASHAASVPQPPVAVSAPRVPSPISAPQEIEEPVIAQPSSPPPQVESSIPPKSPVVSRWGVVGTKAPPSALPAAYTATPTVTTPSLLATGDSSWMRKPKLSSAEDTGTEPLQQSGSDGRAILSPTQSLAKRVSVSPPLPPSVEANIEEPERELSIVERRRLMYNKFDAPAPLPDLSRGSSAMLLDENSPSKTASPPSSVKRFEDRSEVPVMNRYPVSSMERSFEDLPMGPSSPERIPAQSRGMGTDAAIATPSSSGADTEWANRANAIATPSPDLAHANGAAGSGVALGAGVSVSEEDDAIAVPLKKRLAATVARYRRIFRLGNNIGITSSPSFNSNKGGSQSAGSSDDERRRSLTPAKAEFFARAKNVTGAWGIILTQELDDDDSEGDDACQVTDSELQAFSRLLDFWDNRRASAKMSATNVVLDDEDTIPLSEEDIASIQSLLQKLEPKQVEEEMEEVDGDGLMPTQAEEEDGEEIAYIDDSVSDLDGKTNPPSPAYPIKDYTPGEHRQQPSGEHREGRGFTGFSAPAPVFTSPAPPPPPTPPHPPSVPMPQSVAVGSAPRAPPPPPPPPPPSRPGANGRQDAAALPPPPPPPPPGQAYSSPGVARPPVAPTARGFLPPASTSNPRGPPPPPAYAAPVPSAGMPSAIASPKRLVVSQSTVRDPFRPKLVPEHPGQAVGAHHAQNGGMAMNPQAIEETVAAAEHGGRAPSNLNAEVKPGHQRKKSSHLGSDLDAPRSTSRDVSSRMDSSSAASDASGITGTPKPGHARSPSRDEAATKAMFGLGMFNRRKQSSVTSFESELKPERCLLEVGRILTAMGCNVLMKRGESKMKCEAPLKKDKMLISITCTEEKGVSTVHFKKGRKDKSNADAREFMDFFQTVHRRFYERVGSEAHQ